MPASFWLMGFSLTVSWSFQSWMDGGSRPAGAHLRFLANRMVVDWWFCSGIALAPDALDEYPGHLFALLVLFGAISRVVAAADLPASVFSACHLGSLALCAKKWDKTTIRNCFGSSSNSCLSASSVGHHSICDDLAGVVHRSHGAEGEDRMRTSFLLAAFAARDIGIRREPCRRPRNHIREVRGQQNRRELDPEIGGLSASRLRRIVRSAIR